MEKLAKIHDITHESHGSPHPDPASGGNILFVKKDLLGPGTKPVFYDIVAGRANGALMQKHMQSIEIINVHNFGLNRKERNCIFTRIAAAKRRAAADLSGKSVLLLLGDFNFLAPGETMTKLSNIESNTLALVSRESEPDVERWSTPLANITEIYQPEHTRIGDRTESNGTRHYTASRLDRVYISWPPWVLMQLRATANVVLPVPKCAAMGLSDHAPVRISLSCKRMLPRSSRPIPKWLAKHPIFQSVLADLEIKAHLDELAPAVRWTKHKEIV